MLQEGVAKITLQILHCCAPWYFSDHIEAECCEHVVLLKRVAIS